MSAPARQSSGNPVPASKEGAAVAPGPKAEGSVQGRIHGIVAPGSAAANEATSSESSDGERNNLISRTVEELYGLLAQSHERREDLIAHGVTFHMLNALIELGVHDKLDEQAKMMETAVQASFAAHGPQAITPEELKTSVQAIVTVEKDTRHVRQMAAQQGVHMLALNHLTQMMRLNPGDRGQQAINTFVAYADAAGIKLDQVQSILASHEEEAKSVLPQIAPDTEPGKLARIQSTLNDIIVGLVLTAIVMWMVL